MTSVPCPIYRPLEPEIVRTPPEFVLISGNRPGTPDAAVGSVFWGGVRDRHAVVQSLTFRVTVSANAGAETRLIGLRVMLDDAGTDRGSLWELRARDAAGVGLRSDNGPDCVYPAGTTGNQAAFNPVLEGVWVPAGVGLRLQSFTGGGVPVSHEIRWTAVLLLVPIGGLLRA
jgi:hypothetical protein